MRVVLLMSLFTRMLSLLCAVFTFLRSVNLLTLEELKTRATGAVVRWTSEADGPVVGPVVGRLLVRSLTSMSVCHSY